MACSVVTLSILLETPDVLGRDFGRRQLVELAGKPERDLVVLIVHWRLGGAHVEGFVDGRTVSIR
jgi:hypothetical protein